MQSVTQQQIVQAARSWIGTRFHHQGRVKKTAFHTGGVDCLGLLMGVARELELRNRHGEWLANLDQPNYSRLFDVELLAKKLSDNLWPVEKRELIPGDIALVNIKDRQKHIVFISLYNISPRAIYTIHADARAKRVVENILSDEWYNHIELGYRLI